MDEITDEWSIPNPIEDIRNAIEIIEQEKIPTEVRMYERTHRSIVETFGCDFDTIDNFPVVIDNKIPIYAIYKY